MHNYLPQIQERIDLLLSSGKPIVIAIEGCCTAGKTTLAAEIARRYDCNLFHMDDFFLRPHQRTASRLAEPGGNLDRERFTEEILLPLSTGKPFSYHRFDCSTLSLSIPIAVEPKPLTLIEGTYCLHPSFGTVYDLTIFLSVSPETQRSRLMDRPSFLLNRFLQEWIPMENRYFDHFSIRSRCDIQIHQGQIISLAPQQT